jgi:putative SOS response-associated peptidase YedK
MCGRFVSASPPDEIARYFDAEGAPEALEPSYNVAPTNDVYAVTAEGGVRRVEAYHWGLVPKWAKDPKIGSRMINARSETLAEKNAYKAAFKRRRCIIPADGFYEWKKPPEGSPRKTPKQPYFINRADGERLAMAGLWEVWKGQRPPKGTETEPAGGPAADEELHSCTIITTEANETMAPLHDRMPVLLPESAWDEWLDPANDDLDTLGKLLVPARPSLLATRPVSTAVNSVRNKGEELLAPYEPDAQLPL